MTENPVRDTGARKTTDHRSTSAGPHETAEHSARGAEAAQETSDHRATSAGPHEGGAPRQRFSRVMRRYFFTGLLVILPATISIFVLWRLFFALDHILGPFIEQYSGYRLPGVGLVALFAIIVGVGAVASNFIGRKLIHTIERLVERIPVMRWIYRTVKQIFSTVLEEESTSFRKVVLVNFPTKGTYSMAFLTAEPGGILDEVTGAKLVAVFLPTTPNPTSGYFLLVPEDEVIPLSMSVNEGLKIIVSAGALTRNR